jgi:hypothetical protein
VCLISASAMHWVLESSSALLHAHDMAVIPILSHPRNQSEVSYSAQIGTQLHMDAINMPTYPSYRLSFYRNHICFPIRSQNPHFFTLPFVPIVAVFFPFSLLAFSLSIKSFMIPCKASFRLVISSTSSVVTVVLPACLEKVSRSVATFSASPCQH